MTVSKQLSKAIVLDEPVNRNKAVQEIALEKLELFSEYSALVNVRLIYRVYLVEIYWRHFYRQEQTSLEKKRGMAHLLQEDHVAKL